jgi:hypothetical protein
LTSDDINDWLAFYELRPFGYTMFAWMFGTLASQFYNVHKANSRSMDAEDFFPIRIRAPAVLTDEQAIEMFQAYNVTRGYNSDGSRRKSG